MRSNAAIFEAIGRAKAAAGIVAEIPAQLRTERAMGIISVSPEHVDRLARICRDVAAQSIALCTLLHEIADSQPTTTGETNGTHAPADSTHRI